MKIGEIRIKFIKKANMWCKITYLGSVTKRSKKTGNISNSDRFKQEWYSDKPEI